jgi:hypothetical protein
MLLKRLLGKIDKILCIYLGLEQEETQLNAVQVIGEKLVITASFKRHSFKESWDNFSTFEIKHTNRYDREKLGMAAGKAIAKKLVVSFEAPPIEKN